MPPRLAQAAASCLRISLLVVATALIWIAHFDRWTLASWQVPIDYNGDAHETLARLKAASEGELVPLTPQVIDRLGAPFGAHWNAYPTPDKPLMLALGALVHLLGVNATANVALVLAQITAALAFYFVARWLGTRWTWAAAGALLFAYTYQTFHRGLAHFSLVFTWTVPLGLLTAWLVARSHRLEWGTRGAVVALCSAVALGASNPYNLFFWLQLMTWALLVQACGERRRGNLEIGVAAIGVAVAAFLVTNAEVWLHVEDTRAMPLLARNYGGTERYALKPVEMFIPPEFHRWDWLAFFGHRYVRWSEWRGEVFLPYLGLIGIAGFAVLAFVTIRAVLQRRPLPGHALSVGWLVAFATIGGVTNLLAFFAGLQVFRATNRVAIFISAIVGLFVVVRLSRWTARWPRWAAAAAAVVVALFGILDEVPRPDSPRKVQAIAQAVHADEEFGRRLDATLAPGAMVFQLPVLGFPEVIPPYQLDSYEHFRPYLATEHVRFSYGTPKLRSRMRWEREVEALPPAEMVGALERYGFSALYVNRHGYADRGNALLAQLQRLGYRNRLESRSGHQVVVLLHPAAAPTLPIAHTFALGQGWHNAADGTTRWAYGDAALSFFNPYPHPISVSIDLALRGATPRNVTLSHEGQPLRQVAVARQPSSIRVRDVRLAPGVNHFTLSSASEPVRVSEAANQLRSFGLQASDVRVGPDSPAIPPAGLVAGNQ